jgi:hypothetical protein
MTDFWVPFLTGTQPAANIPLSRFLPTLPSGMVERWLKANLSPGSWVLDPIGATPALALEAARAGYRVLVASNNPILSFELEVLASAPSAQDFQAALAELAHLRRGEERFDLHLQSLYQTACSACGEIIPTQAFLWKRGQEKPEFVQYHCPNCHNEEERILIPADADRLIPPGSMGLLRARALERVSAAGTEAREGAEEALQSFPPRALYFLLTLINKVEGLAIPEDRHRLLFALILSACEEAVSLWQPGGRTRPRQLSVPPTYRENNLWLALENSIPLWTSQPASIPLTHYPAMPPEKGGICLFQGRVRSIFPLPAEIAPSAILTIIPRPNQALWTLCAIWSGWLWGHDAVTPLHSALERRRYDWSWHTSALFATLSTLRKNIPQDLPLFGILPELVPGFLGAICIAAHAAGFKLEGYALREELAQVSWKASVKETNRKGSIPTSEDIEKSMISFLKERLEPMDHLSLFMAAAEGMIKGGKLPILWNADPAANEIAGKTLGESLTLLQGAVTQVLTSSAVLRRFEGKGHSIEAGWWGLKEAAQVADLPLAERALPLPDRVEMEVVRNLQNHPLLPLDELDQALCNQFPGLLTPNMTLVRACLESYGEQLTQPSVGWRLREQEKPSSRKADLVHVHQFIQELGKQLDFSSKGELPITWLDKGGKPEYLLYPIASSIISRFVDYPTPLPAQRCIIVLPGSRCNLLTFKQRSNQQLAEALNAGWRFLKFRLLRQLVERPDLTRELFETLLDSDPPDWEESTQLKIF